MAQEVIFYIARREPGEPWIKDETTAATDPHLLERRVQTRNTVEKEAGSAIRYKIVREVIDVVDWQERELTRLRTGEYKLVPEGIWRDIARARGGHFLHLGNKPGYVSYTPNEIAGKLDKQIMCLASTYLRKHFNFSADTIEKLLEEIGAPVAKTFVFITDHGPTIAKIYIMGNRGPTHSCMAHGETNWPGNTHPCSLYGKPGNLALAYSMTAKNLDDENNTITARTIVNTDLKLWGRVYGYEHDARRLEKWLTAEGYTQQLYTKGAGTGFDRYVPDRWAGSTFKTVIIDERPITPHIDFCKVMHLDPVKETFTLYKKGQAPKHCKPYTVYTNDFFAKPVPVCEDCGAFDGLRPIVKTTVRLHRTNHMLCMDCRCKLDLNRCEHCENYYSKDIPSTIFSDGRQVAFCPQCIARFVVDCPECRKKGHTGEMLNIHKYNKKHVLTHKRRVCRPCYRELHTKYRAWGNPNF